MDELKRKRLQQKVFTQLKEQGGYHEAFLPVINIYVEMLLQRELLEDKLSSCEGNDNEILKSVIDELDRDIHRYKEALCL